MEKKVAHVVLTCLVASFTFFISCSSPNGKPEPTDTPTSGEVNIVADEGYKPLFETQIYTFESLYVRAKVHVKYKNEAEAFHDILNDSCKVIVINRDITPEEQQLFESKRLFPIRTKIAEDAIAFIVNNENADTTFSLKKITQVISGSDTSWKQVNKNSNLGNIKLIFDNPGSANASYLAHFAKQPKLPANSFAANSNEEVINYVSTHKNALGVISVNWISDHDDSTVVNYLKQVKVVAISQPTDSTRFFKPYQGYIKTKEYPFTRDVYMINRQTRAGLGMGFVSFVAGDAGQRIILKMGLIPAISPTRVIKIN